MARLAQNPAIEWWIHPVADAAERLVNLALFLADAREPVTAERVRSEVFGYPEGQDDAAFIRMFERDKDDLRAMGFVIDGDSEGAYVLDRKRTYAEGVDLSGAEASAILIAGGALADDPAFPFPTELRLALAKISAELDAPQPDTGRLVDEDPSGQGARVAALSAAAASCKRVVFGYTNARGESARREVEPYGLFLHDGRWYLVGRDVSKDAIRTFAVMRMSDLSPNASAPKTPDFSRPEGFDVATYIRLPFQYGDPSLETSARVRFDASEAWRATTLTAGSGDLSHEADGSVVWSTDARSLAGLASFTVANGPGLTPIEPAELRTELVQGLERVVKAHG